MPIEFVVQLIHHNEYPDHLELPEVFYDDAYTGNRHLYLTGIRRNQKKVTLVKTTEGVVEIRGQRWNEFVAENMDEDVNVLHFIEEGEDSFYVTGYDNEGIETGGYEGVNQSYSRFEARVTPYPEIDQNIPADFLAGLGNEAEITISCEGHEFDVRVSRLNPNGHGVLPEYVLNQDNWNDFCGEKDLEFGDVVVFTKIRNDLLNVMGFNVDGSSNTNVKFLGATRLNIIQPQIPHEDKKAERMYHLCMWPGHREHFHERTDVFYKHFSEILAFNRLAIPAKFQGDSPMHLYTKDMLKHNQIELPFTVRMDRHRENPGRTNHGNMFGKWRWFGQECHFEYTKMLRFRLMYVVTDVEGARPTRYPLFQCVRRF